MLDAKYQVIMEIKVVSSWSFFVNMKRYILHGFNPEISLNYWLRHEAGLTGTKWMCNEGGCGSCAILLQRYPSKAKIVNSCLVSLGSIDGCYVTTVEGIGSSQEGFHEIQSKLSRHGGIQCGYCSPGFVMAMQGLLLDKAAPTEFEIEKSFDGNICRCTGYRSIFDAMKCFACKQNADKSSSDIEDLVCNNAGDQRADKSRVNLCSTKLTCSGSTWVRLMSYLDLLNFLKEAKENFMLVCGNTGQGIYKAAISFPFHVDISCVQEFLAITNFSDSVEIGASVTLNDVAKHLSQNADQSVTFEPIASHIMQIAGNPVRNVGSWAGNVMLKHRHNDFPSDICTIFEAGNAKIKVYDIRSQSYSIHSVYGKNGIINASMDEKIIVSTSLPKMKNSGKTRMKCFKIMPRAQNAYAYVNAAFIANLSDCGDELTDAKLVFGGVSASFHRACRTEEYLSGRKINSNDTLKGALNELSKELSIACQNNYKRNLVLGLFYKFYLYLCDTSLLELSVASGVERLARPVSCGRQTFKTDPDTYPVSKDMPKIASLLLASGEAKFMSDSPPSRGDLYCDVILSSVGNADIDVIDFTEAERIPGFVQIISKDNFPKDVLNAWYGPKDPSLTIIASKHVTYAGHVVAIAIAESIAAVRKVAAAVKVRYKNLKKPLLTIKDAIQANSFHTIAKPQFVLGEPDLAISSAKHVVTGELEFGHQYHFYMETLVCRVEQTEDHGFLVDTATQSQSNLQATLSYAFGVPANKIEITTKRLGGAYGGKACNSHLTTCITALAAHVTRRPVHFEATLETCMKMLGSRTPYAVQYTAGFGDDGVITGIDACIYMNGGCGSIAGENVKILHFSDSAYFCPNRRYKNFLAKTNLPASTWCRAPASLQMTGTAELIVEHVASYLKKDPVQVKLANMYKEGQADPDGTVIQHTDFRAVFHQLLSKYSIRERMKAVQNFNANNKWKKKGLAVTPMKYSIGLMATSSPKHAVLISIYKHDGSVVVSHGGIDSGQGINIKVAQVVSYKLGIPGDKVKVQRTSTITSANSTITGGSVTTEVVCQSAIDCCDILNARMSPIRSKMAAGTSWVDLVHQCYSQHVDLTAYKIEICAAATAYRNLVYRNETEKLVSLTGIFRIIFSGSEPRNQKYPSFGVTAAEIEYDVITGERQILQVDIIFDCGISINPHIDIGQIEGAFMMGVGFWLTEKMDYDQTTGQLLSVGTWEYKPPSSQDIPIRWNIDLLPDTPNPVGVLRSKAIGEPPICMAVCVAIALKRAVEASRKDRGLDQYFTLPSPATVDALHNSLTLNPLEEFTL